MAKKVENQTEGKPLTRAQKTDATKQIVRELLAQKPTKHNELIDEVAKLYVARHGEEGENPNDVKGRVGSVLDIMQKSSDVAYDGGTYALKARMPMAEPVKTKENPAPKKRTRAKKVAEKSVETPATPAAEAPKAEEIVAEKTEEKPAPKKRVRAKKVVEKVATETPAAPVAEAPKAEEIVAEKTEEEGKPAPKKRGRKPKAVEAEKTEEKPVETVEEKPVEKAETPVETPAPVVEKAVAVEVPAPVENAEERALVEKPKAELAQKGVVMDMSFLFGDKAAKAKKAPEKQERPAPKAQANEGGKKEEKTPVKERTVKPTPKAEIPANEGGKVEVSEGGKTAKPVRGRGNSKAQAALTPDEKLKEAFLKKMRSLGGDYFEYYSVYLLERYSIKNGRRLEGLRISGGDHDGGIDGEIELTDALGFKETIYIQSKNWDPDKGKEEKWVVGETLLQQFIGACACRQAKDKKLHARGIFITTSRFTPDAKRILEDMADKIVGYDGGDLYEAAKECAFGLVKKNGEWALDEKLLSGPKAFFQSY